VNTTREIDIEAAFGGLKDERIKNTTLGKEKRKKKGLLK